MVRQIRRPHDDGDDQDPFSDRNERPDSAEPSEASSVSRSVHRRSDSNIAAVPELVEQRSRRPAPRPVRHLPSAASTDDITPAPRNDQVPMSEKQERTVSDPVLPDSKEKVAGATEDGKPGLWKRLVNEYQKNYCPKESPPLVLPSAPNDKEKYSYVRMNRIPLLTVGLFSLLALATGSWLFIKTSPWYCWYAFYAVLSQFYLFTSYFITILGKAFDLDAHKKLLAGQPLNEDTAPTVDIYLPVCKEAYEVLDNTWHHIAAVQYPAGKMRVLVLDDGAQESVQTLAGRYGFEYILRDNRPELKKAGNLRYAFARTSGDFFTVFDADFCPRPDFLQELIPYHLNDPKIAIIQTPQFFRSMSNQTWTEQGAGSVQEYFYRIVQTCRNTWGGAICVGSNAIYRREALAAVGGTAPADCSEDVHTGFYAVTRGWTVRYLPLVLACGVCPDLPRAFFSQQMRWCTGSMSLLTHRDFWKSNLTKKQKFCYLTGFFYYSTTAIATFLNPIPAPLLLWSHPNYFRYYNLFFAFPSVFLGLIALRLWARSRYTFSVQYSQVIMGYAYLHAIWDRFFGTKMVWLPSGDGKAHKNNRYRNMRILCWAWTITHNAVLVTGCVWQISRGVVTWYHVIPALWLDLFNLICIHRFLLYNHPKG